MSSIFEAETDFNKEVIAPLFWGLPQFPYNTLYSEWGAFRSFLIKRGVPEEVIPHCEEGKWAGGCEKPNEDDFLVQVIIAFVLREISFYIRKYERIYLENTEWQAVKCFLAIVKKRFDAHWQEGTDVQAASRFSELSGVFVGHWGRVINAASQRLEYFYKTEIAREARHRRRPDLDLSPASGVRFGKYSPTVEEIIVKEEFVKRLHRAIIDHPHLRTLIDQVNIRLKEDDRQLQVVLDEEDIGLFSVGQTQIDLRNILLRIFAAVKPEAELLLTFLVSKIQPNRVNVIELNYERGLAEFELAMMIEEGYMSTRVSEAIGGCNPDTAFPKVVWVCTSILESVLGKKVHIYFNRRGEVIIELPELDERNSKNLALALRRKLEEAILKESADLNGGEAPPVDPETAALLEIGERVESEAEQLYRLDQLAQNGADEEEQKSHRRVVAAVAASEEMALATAQPRSAQAFELLEGEEGMLPDPLELQDRPIDGDYIGLASHPDEGDEQAGATAVPDYFDDAALDGQLDELEQRFAESAKLRWREINGRLERVDDHHNHTPVSLAKSTNLSAREITMAILSTLHRQNPKPETLYESFFAVLDQVAESHCGQTLTEIFPELRHLTPNRRALALLKSIRYQRKSRGNSDSVDVFLDGALLASSTLKLATG